ncbi:hypothetical protein BC830DRAFT_140105 [Chytriomyces sp. MP71]|nr:hypothetical protein BC830DRAFT_140105 [Chytriomyces sp. MP71]
MGSEDEEEYTSSSQYRRLSYAPQNPPLLPPDASIQAQQRLQNQMMEDAGLIDELYISTQQVAKAVSLKMGMENESVSSSVLAAATLLAGGQISHDFANQAPHHPPVIKRRPSFFASAGHGIANVLGTSSSSSTHLSGTSNGSIAQWFTPQTSQQQPQPPPTPQLQRKPSINNLTNEANDGGLVRKLSKKLSMVFIGAGGSNVTPTSTLTPAMSTDLTATTSSTLPDSPATTATPVYATPSGYMSAPGTPKPDPREPAGGARKTGGRRLSLTTSFGSGKSLMSRILPLTSRSAAATPQPRSATPSTTTDSTSASGGGGGGGGGGESLDFEGVKGEGAGMLMPFACEHCGRPVWLILFVRL